MYQILQDKLNITTKSRTVADYMMKKQYLVDYQKTVIIIRRRELIENNQFFIILLLCILFAKMMILQKNTHEFCYRCRIDRRNTKIQ